MREGGHPLNLRKMWDSLGTVVRIVLVTDLDLVGAAEYKPYGSGNFLMARLSTAEASLVLFLVFSRCSRRFGLGTPFTPALLLAAEVGVWFWPGRVFLALEGEDEGAEGLIPFTFV